MSGTTTVAEVTVDLVDAAATRAYGPALAGLLRAGDLVVAFTPSGRSPNVVTALAAARANGATTLLLAGGDGGPARAHADHLVLVPSAATPRIQEMHTLVLHVISEMVDAWAADEAPTA